MENVEKLKVQIRLIDLASSEDSEVSSKVEHLIKQEAKRLSDQASTLEGMANSLDEIDFEDPRMVQELISERRNLSVERVNEIWLEIKRPDREKDEREAALMWKGHLHSSVLRYFTITNARRNTIHLLADNAEVARYIAWDKKRIVDRTQGNLRSFDSRSIEALPYAKGLEEAIAAGFPGELDIMGDKVVHKVRKKVFG